MKRLSHIIFALMIAAVVLTFVPSTRTADAPTNCRTPVSFGSFLWGLSYQNEILVYALGCPVKEMTVIFKISDIIWLDVHTVTKEEYEESAEYLPAGDPRREEWKTRIGITEFAAQLRYRPTGNLVQDTWIEEYSKPYKPLSKPIQEMLKAYEEGKTSTTAVWARVQFVSAERVEGTPFVVAWVFLQPYKVERKSG